MNIARRCLKDDGLFLLHTIGGNKSVITTDPWMEKYIFPGGVLPSIKQISKATEGKVSWKTGTISAPTTTRP
jgi:cyclopropane-fatty-acyl-phospholipid synthase